METKFTFKILTQEDKLFTIAKNISVFKIHFCLRFDSPTAHVTFRLNIVLQTLLPQKLENLKPEPRNFTATVYGENFCLAPGLRLEYFSNYIKY